MRRFSRPASLSPSQPFPWAISCCSFKAVAGLSRAAREENAGTSTMKPNFALDLSHEGIGLFHRSKGGWTLVGDVALDDPDLPQKVDILRKNAADLEKGGFSTKLIIPNSQILFTTLTAPGPDEIAREVQIRAGLEGLTPYEVGELVFDWQAKGDTVTVAVIARETLAEAEAFASEHRMNPVSFVARAGQNGFSGEAFFGKSGGASALLGPGQRVDRDAKPVPRQTEQRVIPAAPAAPESPEPSEPKDETTQETPTPPASKSEPVVLTSPGPDQAEPPADTLAPFPDIPAGVDPQTGDTPAKAGGPDRVDPGRADPNRNDPGRDDQDDLEQALASVPDPDPAPRTPSTPSVPPAPKTSKSTPVSAPMLAPFPSIPDDTDEPAPLPPITPVIRDLPEDKLSPEKPNTEKASAEKTGDKVKSRGGKGKKTTQQVSKTEADAPVLPDATGDQVERTFSKTAAASLAKAPAPADVAKPMSPSAAPSMPTRADSDETPNAASGAASSAASDATPGAPPVTPAFSTRRAPQAAAQTTTPTASPPDPHSPPSARFAPDLAGGTPTQTPTTAPRLGAVSRADTRDGTGLPKAPVAPGPQPHVPVTAPSLIPDPEDAATKSKPLQPKPLQPKSLKSKPVTSKPGKATTSDSRDRAAASGAALMAAARKGLSGAAGQAGKAGKALASRTASRTASRKAAKTIQATQAVTKDATASTATTPAKLAMRLPGLGRKSAQSTPPGAAPDTAIAPPPARRSEAEALTVFGARSPSDVGGKPRYLGLILTLVLLLAMAVAAVWSMFFLSDDATASFIQPDQDLIAALEAPADTLPPGPSEAPDVSEIAPEPDPDITEPDPSLGAAPEPLDQAAAEARYAATGIWQRAPEPAQAPSGDRVDDLYVASIDPALRGQDAVALPPASSLGAGDTPRASATPPPPGTRFDLDENGLVLATPQGALNPDGVMVIAGRPAVVPGRRPNTGPAAAPVLTQPDLPRIRPTRRPEGLVESSQRATLGGRTLEQLATLPPQRRPQRALPPQPDPAAVAEALAQAQEGADEPLAPASEYAIATSPQPAHRPRNFDRIVSRATPTDNSDGSTVVAAAATTRAPSIPTRASVAQQATMTNAINLNRINLIGIYGSSSARRALVRMSNGRYVKVSVGDRLNGGKVTSITASKLTYQKGGKTHTLEVLPLG